MRPCPPASAALFRPLDQQCIPVPGLHGIVSRALRADRVLASEQFVEAGTRRLEQVNAPEVANHALAVLGTAAGQTLAKGFLRPEALAGVPDKCPEYSGSKIPCYYPTQGSCPSGVDLQGQTGREQAETIGYRLAALAPSLTSASAASSRRPTGNPEALPLPNRGINSRTHLCHVSRRVLLFNLPPPRAADHARGSRSPRLSAVGSRP